MSFVADVYYTMNWQAFILAFFLVLNVSAEACAAPVVVEDKDQPHALCITDDAGQQKIFSVAVHDDELLITPSQMTAAETGACTAGMRSALVSPARWLERTHERLHRRLCVERC